MEDNEKSLIHYKKVEPNESYLSSDNRQINKNIDLEKENVWQKSIFNSYKKLINKLDNIKIGWQRFLWNSKTNIQRINTISNTIDNRPYNEVKLEVLEFTKKYHQANFFKRIWMDPSGNKKVNAQLLIYFENKILIEKNLENPSELLEQNFYQMLLTYESESKPSKKVKAYYQANKTKRDHNEQLLANLKIKLFRELDEIILRDEKSNLAFIQYSFVESEKIRTQKISHQAALIYQKWLDEKPVYFDDQAWQNFIEKCYNEWQRKHNPFSQKYKFEIKHQIDHIENNKKLFLKEMNEAGEEFIKDIQNGKVNITDRHLLSQKIENIYKRWIDKYSNERNEKYIWREILSKQYNKWKEKMDNIIENGVQNNIRYNMRIHVYKEVCNEWQEKLKNTKNITQLHDIFNKAKLEINELLLFQVMNTKFNNDRFIEELFVVNHNNFIDLYKTYEPYYKKFTGHKLRTELINYSDSRSLLIKLPGMLQNFVFNLMNKLSKESWDKKLTDYDDTAILESIDRIFKYLKKHNLSSLANNCADFSLEYWLLKNDIFNYKTDLFKQEEAFKIEYLDIKNNPLELLLNLKNQYLNTLDQTYKNYENIILNKINALYEELPVKEKNKNKMEKAKLLWLKQLKNIQKKHKIKLDKINSMHIEMIKNRKATGSNQDNNILHTDSAKQEAYDKYITILKEKNLVRAHLIENFFESSNLKIKEGLVGIWKYGFKIYKAMEYFIEIIPDFRIPISYGNENDSYHKWAKNIINSPKAAKYANKIHKYYLKLNLTLHPDKINQLLSPPVVLTHSDNSKIKITLSDEEIILVSDLIQEQAKSYHEGMQINYAIWNSFISLAKEEPNNITGRSTRLSFIEDTIKTYTQFPGNKNYKNILEEIKRIRRYHDIRVQEDTKAFEFIKSVLHTCQNQRKELEAIKAKTQKYEKITQYYENKIKERDAGISCKINEEEDNTLLKNSSSFWKTESEPTKSSSANFINSPQFN